MSGRKRTWTAAALKTPEQPAHLTKSWVKNSLEDGDDIRSRERLRDATIAAYSGSSYTSHEAKSYGWSVQLVRRQIDQVHAVPGLFCYFLQI